MTITMTMEEYLALKKQAENYKTMVAVAKNIVKNNEYNSIRDYQTRTDCYNYVHYASEEEIGCLVGQFGII